MFDKVRQAVDDACDQDLIVAQGMLRKAAKFMSMARVGERQEEAADIGQLQRRQNILQRNIAIVRRFRISPADVEPDPVARNIDQRAVDSGDQGDGQN